MANMGGFSWKRACGITKAKRRISKATGIPLTKSGRQRKVGKMVTGGCCGCVIQVCTFLLFLMLLGVLIW